MGDTRTSPGKGSALATLSWLSPIRRPRLRKTVIGATLRPYGAGSPTSEHLPIEGMKTATGLTISTNGG